MAGDDDVIVHVNVTEESPLLNDRAEDRQDHDGEEKRTPLSWYAWRLFWTIIAAFVLVIFIKGWIDAGDVNVGVYNARYNCHRSFALRY